VTYSISPFLNGDAKVGICLILTKEFEENLQVFPNSFQKKVPANAGTYLIENQ
jgi:hypothetical protein